MKLNKSSIKRVAVKITSIIPTYIAPYLFLGINQGGVYGEAVSSIAGCQISVGWLLSSLQKTYVYSKDQEDRFRVQVLCALCVISAYMISITLLGIGNIVNYQAAIVVLCSVLARGWMLKKGVIGMQVILAGSLLPLSAIFTYIISIGRSLALTSSNILSVTAGLCLLLWIPRVISYEKRRRNKSGKERLKLTYKQVVRMFRDSSKIVFMDIEVTLISQLPYVLSGMAFGSESVAKLSAIKSVVQTPCLYQGYSNPYYGHKIRELLRQNGKNKIKSIYEEQRKKNTNAALLVVIIAITSLMFVQKISMNYDLEQLINVVRVLKENQTIIIVGLISYWVVCWCGPVTTTLLALQKGRELSIVSLISSVIGIITLMVATKLGSLSALILATFAPAILSNLLSRHLLNEGVFGGQST